MAAGNEAGWAASGKQETCRRAHANRDADFKVAPFLELWMHNESDQKVWSEFTTADWVNAVRADAAIMRGATGLTAAEHRYSFSKVRYFKYGDPARIFAGMAQLAADASFNAVVSDAGLSLAMNYDAGDPGEHMRENDAFQLSQMVAGEISAFYS